MWGRSLSPTCCRTHYEAQQRFTCLALHMLAVPLHCPSTFSPAHDVMLRQALLCMVGELRADSTQSGLKATCVQVPSGVDYLRLTKVDH